MRPRRERRLLAEGIRDPLVVWPCEGQLVLVDGHNRHEIAETHGLAYTTFEIHFPDVDTCLEWIYRNQIGRRNLTDEERAIVLGRLNERRKQGHGGARKEGAGEQEERFTSGPNAVARTLAAEARVCEKTVRNAAKFARAYEQLAEVSTEAAARVARGEIKDALTRLPKLSEPDIAALAERLESGEDRIATRASKPRQQSIDLGPPAALTGEQILAHLRELHDTHAIALPDGCVLAVRDGQTLIFSLAAGLPADEAAWVRAGASVHRVASALEAEAIVTGEPGAAESDHEDPEGVGDETEDDPTLAAML